MLPIQLVHSLPLYAGKNQRNEEKRKIESNRLQWETHRIEAKQKNKNVW